MPILALLLSCVLTGLIWFVQIVHYPLFHQVPSEVFFLYEALHQKRTGWVVIPLMLTELILTVCLILYYPPTLFNLGQAVMTVFIWLSTIFIQSPIHQLLAKKKSDTKINWLVQSNWLRTISWTLRGFFLYQMATI